MASVGNSQMPYKGAVMEDKEKIEKAVKIAWQYAQYDGSHHKMWVIDQMVRVLLGENEYKNFVNAYQTLDGEDYYTWDMGVAPQNLHFMVKISEEIVKFRR